VPRSETKWTFPSSVNAPCVDSWTGITRTCSQHNNQYDIAELSLPGYNMRGIISPAIGNLTNLIMAKLYNNNLKGTIPSEIGQLTSLQDWDLHANQLGGSIPSEIGKLILLIELELYSNQLTGSIPSEIGRMASMFRSLFQPT
jgi:Leucine-rich repeat (LRR) protein